MQAAAWKMSGVVSEVRVITSPKNASWKGYAVKLQTLGATYELSLTEELFATVAQGDQIDAAGGFEEFGGRVKFIAKNVKVLTQGAAK